MSDTFIKDYLELKDEYKFIDLRTPKEFSEGTIGDAVNVPIFSDEERAVIGTVYKKQSVEKAKKMAIETVSAKLPFIYETITGEYKKNPRIALFCARGGMRSQTPGSLLNAMDYDVKVVSGGYKGYRNRVLEKTDEITAGIKFVVIHGNTGVGKTKILAELKKRGENVLDLEGLARHRGSMLGKVGIDEHITQKQFEHELFEAVCAIKDPFGRCVFVEAESRRLGGITIPDSVMTALKSSKDHINAYADMDVRVKNILDDYILDENCVNDIIDIIPRFKKFIGNNMVERLEDMMRAGDFSEVVRFLAENHYDPKYEHPKYDYSMELNVNDLSEAVDILVGYSVSRAK